METFRGLKVPTMNANECDISALMHVFCERSSCAGVDCRECIYNDANFHDFKKLIERITTNEI